MHTVALALVLLGAAPPAVDLPPITPGPALTLAEALERAEAHNLTLAASRLEVDKADAQLGKAWATLLPVLTGSFSLTHNDHADTFNIVDNLGPLFQALGMPPPAGQDLVVRRQDDVRAGVQAGMPLVSVPAWLGVGAGRLGVEVAELSVAEARQRLLYGVAQAFWMAYISRELVGIEESQLTAAARHLDLANVRVAQGDALRIDVVRAQTEVEKARQDLLAAHLNLDNARDVLSNLIGSEELVLPEAPPEVEAPASETDRGVEGRPDVQAARRAARLADKMADVAWAQLLPTVGVSGQLGYLFSDPPDLGSQDRSRWSALLVLSVPLYSQTRYADIEAQRAAHRQAELRAEDVAAKASLEVRKADRDYRAALATLETAEHQAALAKEALELTESAYQNGAATSLDVTDAQRTQTTASLNAAAQRLRSQISLLALLRAVGEDPATLAQRAP